MIPDTLLGGRVTEKPFSKFYEIMTKGMSFYITIDGHLFEIPFQFWWQTINNAPCIQKTPASYDGSGFRVWGLGFRVEDKVWG